MKAKCVFCDEPVEIEERSDGRRVECPKCGACYGAEVGGWERAGRQGKTGEDRAALAARFPERTQRDYGMAESCIGACAIMGGLSVVGTVVAFAWMIYESASLESILMVVSCLVGALFWWVLATALKVAVTISKDLGEIAFASKVSAYWIDRANTDKPAAEPPTEGA